MFQIWNILLMFAAAENDLKNYGPSYKENGQLGTSIRKGKIYYEAKQEKIVLWLLLNRRKIEKKKLSPGKIQVHYNNRE